MRKLDYFLFIYYLIKHFPNELLVLIAIFKFSSIKCNVYFLNDVPILEYNKDNPVNALWWGYLVKCCPGLGVVPLSS